MLYSFKSSWTGLEFNPPQMNKETSKQKRNSKKKSTAVCSQKNSIISISISIDCLTM